MFIIITMCANDQKTINLNKSWISLYVYKNKKTMFEWQEFKLMFMI